MCGTNRVAGEALKESKVLGRRRSLAVGTVLGMMAAGGVRADDPAVTAGKAPETVAVAGSEADPELQQVQDTQQPALAPAPQPFAPETASPTGAVFTPVNTPLATLSGFETYAEYDCNKCITSFATMSFVEGRDHSRSEGGQDFFNPATAMFFHDPNAPRGILPGSDEEPLPSIPPLEARVGFRVHEPVEWPRYGAEFAARIVDNQDRIARSLGEVATSGFTTYDVRGFWRACEHLTLISGVENFTDKFYREHLDYRTGRGVFQPGINFSFVAEFTH